MAFEAVTLDDGWFLGENTVYTYQINDYSNPLYILIAQTVFQQTGNNSCSMIENMLLQVYQNYEKKKLYLIVNMVDLFCSNIDSNRFFLGLLLTCQHHILFSE